MGAKDIVTDIRYAIKKASTTQAALDLVQELLEELEVQKDALESDLN